MLFTVSCDASLGDGTSLEHSMLAFEELQDAVRTVLTTRASMSQACTQDSS